MDRHEILDCTFGERNIVRCVKMSQMGNPSPSDCVRQYSGLCREYSPQGEIILPRGRCPPPLVEGGGRGD
jgi:hypothetical protein